MFETFFVFVWEVLNFSFVNLCEDDIFLKDWDVIIPARGFKEAGFEPQKRPRIIEDGPKNQV